MKFARDYISQCEFFVQLTVLERIASHRTAGVLRSEMAKAVSMDAKSFHYIATVRLITVATAAFAI